MEEGFSGDGEVGISADHIEEFIFFFVFGQVSPLLYFRLVDECVGHIRPKPLPIVDEVLVS